MKKRSTEKELMDLGPEFYTHQEYRDCLKKLGVIGKWLGGNRATLWALRSLDNIFRSIIDVGCGNGALAHMFAQKFSNVRVVGVDIDQDAIKAAQEKPGTSNLTFQHQKNTSLLSLGQIYDVVHICLVCHHMTDDELVQFLVECKTVARKAIVINDLQRSLISYMLFWVVSPLFFNRMTRYDGLLSIKRGFRKAELKNYLKQAGFAEHQYTITWHWAFRWVVVVRL